MIEMAETSHKQGPPQKVAPDVSMIEMAETSHKQGPPQKVAPDVIDDSGSGSDHSKITKSVSVAVDTLNIDLKELESPSEHSSSESEDGRPKEDGRVLRVNLGRRLADDLKMRKSGNTGTVTKGEGAIPKLRKRVTKRGTAIPVSIIGNISCMVHLCNGSMSQVRLLLPRGHPSKWVDCSKMCELSMTTIESQ
jgi:hypothetical protein